MALSTIFQSCQAVSQEEGEEKKNEIDEKEAPTTELASKSQYIVKGVLYDTANSDIFRRKTIRLEYRKIFIVI